MMMIPHQSIHGVVSAHTLSLVLYMNSADIVSSIGPSSHHSAAAASHLLSHLALFQHTVSRWCHLVDAMLSHELRYLFSPATSAVSPQKISMDQTEKNLQGAFEPFRDYTRLLAEGKLDAYHDSIDPQDKIPVPGMVLSSDVHLLIHELGLPERVDKARIKDLFVRNTTFVVLEIANTPNN
jgi:hypothetical protein